MTVYSISQHVESYAPSHIHGYLNEYANLEELTTKLWTHAFHQ